jgi:hypothetical protein
MIHQYLQTHESNYEVLSYFCRLWAMDEVIRESLQFK